VIPSCHAKVRVLYVHRQEGNSVGGAWRALCRMIPVIQACGIAPELLFTLDVQTGNETRDIPASRLPLPAARKAKSLPRYPASLRRLSAFLKEARPDVVHLNELDDVIFFTLAGRMAGGIPIVATARSFLKSPDRFRKFRAHRLDRLICVSEAVRRQAIEGGVPPERTLVVHDPPDARWSEPPEKGEIDRWRDILRIRPGSPVIGTVGNLSPVKGTDVLVRALPRAASRFPDMRCVIVGADDRNLQADLLSLAKSLGVRENVVFAGPLQDPRPAVFLMDVFVLPSRLEGYGLVLLEAMSYGKPVVASGIGGITDIVNDGTTGVLVPSGDPEALGKAVTDLLGDRERRERMGAAASLDVRVRFGESDIGKLCRLYRDLVGTGP
jgi:glycosyltransferase involved in cell wall biosynthesis